MQRALASWFGTGLILGRLRGSDTGSGTVGSLFALPIALLVGVWAGWPAQAVATLVVLSAGVWSVSAMVSRTGDAGWIAIDEAAGTFLAVTGLTTLPGVLVSFVVFRAADIFKGRFPGVERAEGLPGAAGVMADDLVAGVYGLVAGLIVESLL